MHIPDRKVRELRGDADPETQKQRVGRYGNIWLRREGNLASTTLLKQVTTLSSVAQDILDFSTETHASPQIRTVSLPAARPPSA